ncbi:CHAT domain-containing protein [Amycolatopsis sp. cg9]|uniref:CHAT domain-containing protein n=1 Tax=Amycolatopsis sp. cg9 TaxID=3238801 RepID=UPI0035241E67
MDDTNVRFTSETHERTYTCQTDGDGLHTATTTWLSQLLRDRADAVSGEGLKILGRHLYDRVFRGEVDLAFRQTFEKFRSRVKEGRANALRLVITFHPLAEDLTNLPWEFLYLTHQDGSGTFLTGESHSLVLTRVLSDQREFPDNPRDNLSILFALCTPDGTNEGTTKELQALFHDETALTARPLHQPTFSQLKKEISDLNPDIVHLVAHGEPGKIVLPRESDRIAADEARVEIDRSRRLPTEPIDRTELVDTSKLRELFGSTPPSLIFLHSCHGGGTDTETLYCTAVEIVRSGVPAVIAMQYDIGATEADIFAAAFYKALIDNQTIGQAVFEGRKQLAVREQYAWDHRDFGTPVIYLQRDIEIVKARHRSPRPERETRPPQGTCPRCSAETRAIYKLCAECSIPLVCPCSWQDAAAGCSCREDLQKPQSGRCPVCTHAFEVPRYQPDEPAGQPRALPRTPQPPGDGFERAS